MFISAASKTHELLALVPLDLLHDVRSLFSLVSRNGKSLDRQARLPTHALADLTRRACRALSGGGESVLNRVAPPQELETLVAYLGLDWSNEEVDSFVQSRGSCGLLQFMSTFVRIIEQVRVFAAPQALAVCAAVD